jgi:hypothetical protein
VNISANSRVYAFEKEKRSRGETRSACMLLMGGDRLIDDLRRSR